MNNNNRPNLVSLDQWKHDKRESSFSSYLKVLSFNDLVNESNHLASEIKRQAAADHLLSKTKLMMNELTHRLERESKMLAHSVIDLKKQIEDRMIDRD
jgi:5-bromo-4-chloroindolyl phosphate hydrolysis protein